MSEIVPPEAREAKTRADIETGEKRARNPAEEDRRRRIRWPAEKKPGRCREGETKPQKAPLEEEAAERERIETNTEDYNKHRNNSNLSNIFLSFLCNI